MKIRVDSDACGDPMECRICLERCPSGVFGTHPRRRRGPGRAADKWIVDVIFASQCSGCKECMAFCPKQAIRIK